MQKIVAGYIALLLLLAGALAGVKALIAPRVEQPLYDNSQVAYPSRVEGKEFQIYTGSGWEELFLTGVNIGAGKPGAYPGQVAITTQEYLRWFEQIGALGANVIRVYIPQSPAFYQALYHYNASAPRPLYLLQGVYVDENEVLQYHDVYAADSHLWTDFAQDIRDAADMIHGNAHIPQKVGKAWGNYRWDVSEYVIGWILGIEWEAELVIGTNEANPGQTAFQGTYIYTENASPFEVFLARAAETAVAYETEHYGEQRPVALSNWPTTDPLEHPNEPNPKLEDAVSVNTDHILPTESFAPGLFASYHVYPYYPDFMLYDEKYLQDDPINPYRAYLQELNDFIQVPLLVAEFGVPTSRGITHLNPVTGLHHGGLTETQQGEALVSMLSDIRETGCMGGVVFSWQDEWFKTTWNTTDLDLPDHRASWHDVQTSEQNYGLLSFDPGVAGKGVTVDGDGSEWSRRDLVLEDAGRSLSVRQDEAYLYLKLQVEDFDGQVYDIPIDTLPGQGNTSYRGRSLERGADFLLRIDGRDNSALLVDPYYDPNLMLYEYSITPSFPQWEFDRYHTPDSGEFHPVRQVVNRTMTLPETGRVIPFGTVDTGRLEYGTDLAAGADGTVEVRIPWLSLNVRDPSTRQIMADLHQSQNIESQTAEEFWFGLAAEGEDASVVFSPYVLEGWEVPTYHERLKDSYPILQAALGSSRGPTVMTSGRGFFLSVSGLLLSRDPLVYLLALSASVLVYLIAALFVVQAKTTRRARRQAQAMDQLARGLALIPAPAARAFLDVNYFSTPRGLEALSTFLDRCTPDQVDWLRDAFSGSRLDHVLRQAMAGRNDALCNLAVKVAGELRLTRFEDAIVSLLQTRRQDDDLQYTGLMALALMGRQGSLLLLCLNPACNTPLSFRCLHEIFAAYTGDKDTLYSQLLDAPDPYVRRSCVKCIGAEGRTGFAPRLLPFLGTDNTELLIETIRALGRLGYGPAGEAIAPLAADGRWPVRSAALPALYDIDPDRYLELIVAGLRDPEWWVRANTAQRLAGYRGVDRVLSQVRDSGDRFAWDILRYAIQRQRLSAYGGGEEETRRAAAL